MPNREAEGNHLYGKTLIRDQDSLLERDKRGVSKRPQLIVYLKNQILSANSTDLESETLKPSKNTAAKRGLVYLKERILLSRTLPKQKEEPELIDRPRTLQEKAAVIEKFYRQRIADAADEDGTAVHVPFAEMDRKYGLPNGKTSKIITEAGLSLAVRSLKEKSKQKELQESNDLAWFIGVLFAGGRKDNTPKSAGHMSFTSNNEEALMAFKTIGERLFADEKVRGRLLPPRKDGQNSSVVLQCLPYAKTIGNFSREGKVATMKERYEWVFADDHLPSFASGLLDGGGHITLDGRRRLEFFSTNKQEVDIYKKMFIKLGITDWNYLTSSASPDGVSGIGCYSKEALRQFGNLVVSKSDKTQALLEQMKVLSEEPAKREKLPTEPIVSDYQLARDFLGYSPTAEEWALLKKYGAVQISATTLSRYFGAEGQVKPSFIVARDVLDAITLPPVEPKTREVKQRVTKKGQLLEGVSAILRRLEGTKAEDTSATNRQESDEVIFPSDEELAAQYLIHSKNVSAFLREAGLLKKWRAAQETHKKKEQKSLPESEDAAWLLGVLVGGFVDAQGANGQISLMRDNPELLNAFQSKGENLFAGVTPTTQITERDGELVEKRGFYTKEYAAAVGDMRKEMWAKTVTEKHSWILEQPEYIWKFLEGYLEVSGTVNTASGHRDIKLSTLSIPGVNLLLTMLDKVGIKQTRIIYDRSAKNGVRGIAIRSSGKDLSSFAKHVHLVTPEKEERLAFFR